MEKREGDSMELNIAMVSPYAVRCGVATYTENLNPELSKLGCTVYGVRLSRFGKKSADLMQNVIEGIPVEKISLLHIQHEYGLYQGLEDVFFPTLKTLKKPIITTMHSAGQWEIDKLIADMSDRVIVHNKWCARRFGHLEKSGIIPHGASPLGSPPPPRDECKESLGIDPKIPLVGYLGFISNYKGLETLVEAMIKVPNAGLLIGGGWHLERDTEYIMRLKEWTNEVLPNRCRWLGYVSDGDLSRVYGAMDVMVYPSVFATESGALIMALSHQKAVIASNLHPFKEKAKAGALFTFKSVKDLTRKIKRLLKNEELRKSLEEGARKYVKETSWDKMAKRHIALYESLVG
jgi:glycosyltransferase involved in cell wall biosynthesis